MTEAPKIEGNPSENNVKVETQEVNSSVHSSQPVTATKKRGSNTVIIILAVFLLLILCCCCSFFFLLFSSSSFIEEVQKEVEKELENSLQVTIPANIGTQDSGLQPTEESVSRTINEEQTNGNMTVTLLTVEDPYVPTSTYGLSEDDKLVAVEVRISNDGTKNELVSSYSFQLEDSFGEVQNEAYLYSRIPEFSSKTLEPGDVASGWVTFIVSKDSTDLVLIHEDMVTGNQVEFQL